MEFPLNRGKSPSPPEGVDLGRSLDGHGALPQDGPTVIWPFGEMRRHALVFGALDSGKTETGLRIAHQVAARTDAAVFYLAQLPDPKAPQPFAAVMENAGRRIRSTLDAPMDLWRGEPQGLVERLLGLMPDEEPLVRDREAARAILEIACNLPDGPPRSSAALFERLDEDALFQGETIDQGVRDWLRLRCTWFFNIYKTQIEGDWSWDDSDAAYVAFPRSGRDEHDRLARQFLFSDLHDYLSRRKGRDRPCLLVFEEVYPSEDLLGLLRTANMHETSVTIIAPAGAQISEAQKSGVLDAIDLVLLHQMNLPFEAAALIGRSSDEILGLPEGVAWAMRLGNATKLEVSKAPR